MGTGTVTRTPAVSRLAESLPVDWARVLGRELNTPCTADLAAFIEHERAEHTVFPPPRDVFSAFREAPFSAVRVLILGQDPYHDDGQAHGLAFSVRPGLRIPPSLRNILRELATDLGIPPADHGCLLHWAHQGVLLLNTVLTVRAHEANSHRRKGWEQLTDAVVNKLSQRPEPVVFVLWGGPARRKRALIDEDRNAVVASAHPSPLSAHRGFFGSHPFSAVNDCLEQWGSPPVDWRLPPLTPELPRFSL